MIRYFADKNTQEFWETGKSRGMPPANLRNVAKRKLAALHAAVSVEDFANSSWEPVGAVAG